MMQQLPTPLALQTMLTLPEKRRRALLRYRDIARATSPNSLGHHFPLGGAPSRVPLLATRVHSSASAHVEVNGGLLQLNAWRDPAYGGEWVTGGVCQCQVTNTYGAYFVRSRMTGAGPTQVELLWPASGWPPEIDFDETYGPVTSSMGTLHYTSNNSEIHNVVNVDMTQWHTWGVIWTPTRSPTRSMGKCGAPSRTQQPSPTNQ